MTLSAKTLQAGLDERVLKSADQTAYIEDGRKISWRACAEWAEEMAGRLYKAGVRPKDRVGIWGVNSLVWVICFWSVQCLGAVAVLLNPAYRAQEMREVLQSTDVDWLAVGELKRGLNPQVILEEILEDLPCLKKWFRFDEMARRDAGGDILSLPKTADPEDTAVIIFTSGTTRSPKGVMLGGGQIMRAMRDVSAHMGWQETDRLLMPLPMFHGSGLNCGVVCALQSGMAMVIQKSYHSEKAMAAIEKDRCTVFNAVPSMLILMAGHPALTDYDLSSLRSGILSGAAISPKTALRVKRQLGFRRLVLAYGMTETTTLNTMAAIDEPEECLAASVGRPLTEMALRIWACEGEREAAAGEMGEIQLSGYCVMQGYYGLPELSEKSMTRDGWFRTGDAGFMDISGNLHFKTRLSEMIVRGGENISPAEIEAAIQEYDEAIRFVKVVGVPDDIMQEEIAAVIGMKAGHIDREALTAFLKKRLAYFKIPKYIFETKRLAMTQSGKIDLKAVREEASRSVKQQKEEEYV
ncbi:class I adenylate-forming enzyme family protein [Pseudoramibacter faecis]|uniref:class I adenylate-forming enzyme family protein n=1 Tax=Pseudoramibacter faecis TaxID=3108534 RepID=UPI002E76D4EC|nr:class I adenylate-forming enzyme family protein [Pseudoramibacter sp. HA2172]